MSTDKIEVVEPQVSSKEEKVSVDLAKACLLTCQQVCAMEQVDDAVVVSALAVAAVNAAQKRGMNFKKFMAVVSELYGENDDKSGN